MNTNLSAPPGLNASSLTNDIREIKPPVEIPSEWSFLWWIAGLIILAILAYFLWKWWQKHQQNKLLKPVVPPHIRARQKLQEAMSLIDQPHSFCVHVSDTVRVYLEERFDFRAPERTTEEFLNDLQQTDLLLPHQKQRLSEFLVQCDLVKFARYEPTRSELENIWNSAVLLIDETASADASINAPAPETT